MTMISRQDFEAYRRLTNELIQQYEPTVAGLVDTRERVIAAWHDIHEANGYLPYAMPNPEDPGADPLKWNRTTPDTKFGKAVLEPLTRAEQSLEAILREPSTTKAFGTSFNSVYLQLKHLREGLQNPFEEGDIPLDTMVVYTDTGTKIEERVRHLALVAHDQANDGVLHLAELKNNALRAEQVPRLTRRPASSGSVDTRTAQAILFGAVEPRELLGLKQEFTVPPTLDSEDADAGVVAGPERQLAIAE